MDPTGFAKSEDNQLTTWVNRYCSVLVLTDLAAKPIGSLDTSVVSRQLATIDTETRLQLALYLSGSDSATVSDIISVISYILE
jgi:hypothetical protein